MSTFSTAQIITAITLVRIPWPQLRKAKLNHDEVPRLARFVYIVVMAQCALARLVRAIPMILSHISKVISDIALALTKVLYPDRSNVNNNAAAATRVDLRSKQRNKGVKYYGHSGMASGTFDGELFHAGSVMSPVSTTPVDDFLCEPAFDDWYDAQFLKFLNHSKRCRCFGSKTCKQRRQDLTSPGRTSNLVTRQASRVALGQLKNVQGQPKPTKSRSPSNKAGSTEDGSMPKDVAAERQRGRRSNLVTGHATRIFPGQLGNVQGQPIITKPRLPSDEAGSTYGRLGSREPPREGRIRAINHSMNRYATPTRRYREPPL